MRFLGKFIFIFTLLALLFSYAMFQGGFTSWFLFYSFLPIFLYTLGLLLYPIKNWKVSRQLSHHVMRAGDGVSITIMIDRKTAFPLYYCVVEEAFPKTLNKVDNRQGKYKYLDQPNKLHVNRGIKKIVFPGFKRSIQIPYRMENIPRGEHQLRAIRIRTSDVFGLIKKEHIFQVSSELIAYPSERPIHLEEKSSSFEQGSVSSFSMNLKNTNVASGIREYMPGDRFSWIDWKQTAKKNDVMTKEFEQEKSTDTLIVLDACYVDGLNVLAFEALIEVGVSMMETLRRHASQVGLLSIGEEVTWFPVQHDPTKHEWVRKHLTRLQPTKTQPFSLKLKEEMLKVTNNFFVLLIVNRFDEPLKDTVQQIKLRKKHVSILFIQAEKRISKEEHQLLRQLQQEGVGITVLTEKELIKNPIEVSGL